MTVYFHGSFGLNREYMAGVLAASLKKPGASGDEIAEPFGYKAPFTGRYRSWLHKTGLTTKRRNTELTPVGEVVWVEAHLDNEIQHVQNFVLSVIPQQELCWQSADWYGFLARGTRCRWLSVTDSGATLMVHHEVMRGPLAWLIEWAYRDRIERGLQLVNESVANRAEAIATGNL